ncbi:IclR family transcriptional regulator [Streptomyces sp. NPDC059009]|uniref:IclR family transcriptional regulator n=1 Tax=Streptomyces sp. NPDC059009 TaxID=3346694 RepID=UPI0036AF17DE
MSTAVRPPAAESGVAVLDKAAKLLERVESGPATLRQLTDYSGIARPTTHRLAVALERLGLLARDFEGRFVLGHRLGELHVQAWRDRLAQASGRVLTDLCEVTGLDARLFRRRGRLQVCMATSAESAARPEPLPVGMARPASAGPVAQVLLAWEEPEELCEGLRGARFTAAQLAFVRRQGYAHGPDAMLPDALTYAVPLLTPENRVVAALALTGPQSRLAEAPGRALSSLMIDSAAALSDTLLRAHAFPAQVSKSEL